ncbi:hypothetical protein ABIF14_003003 [Bradyrhizobium elkanii]|uniref:Ig-like domain-containing protein n=1 Tax=Bradyrhizobium diazoefficiens TaxID=1355477 RepID=A0A809X7F4_9BRAD|nr:hypothetical protein XF1B_48490 [Bradyrhizobium diazoefficiens]BCE48433.1 hypothetical protein XF4B_47820 [Bradyrhizobium diazoefficiens]BCE91949.1 hypothetical protein XF10B_47470 [Bradyrhizobium diazoefficiens]BCF26877.1 hypothetical protein XF14B_48290 [Bradyrhizobium diazoefficiens]
MTRRISRPLWAAMRLHEHNQKRRAELLGGVSPLPFMGPVALSKAAAGAADAWCWFHEPRALSVNGKTFFGTNGSDDNSVLTGRTTLYEVDEASGSVISKVMQTSTIAAWWADDHDYPTIVVRPDGRLIVFYVPHRVAAPIYFRISVGVGTMAQGWSQEYNLGNTSAQATYPSPVILSGESNKLYLFYRNGASSGPLSLVTSSDIATVAPPTVDGGPIGAAPTWAAERRLAQSTGTQGIYHKVTSNNVDRIDLLMTDAVGPQAGTKTDVRHAYYQGGQWRSSSGTALGDGSTMIGFTNFTPVATSGAPDNLGDMWCSHIQRRQNGIIEAVFWRFVSTSDHRCYYARWNGTAWSKVEVDAGQGMGVPDSRGGQITDGQGLTEGYYSPGSFFDTVEEGVLYISVGNSANSQLFRYRTINGGASWTRQRVSDLTQENVRPVVPVGRGSKYSVLWLKGDYHMYDFNTNPATTNIGYTTRVNAASRAYSVASVKPSNISVPTISGSTGTVGNTLQVALGSWVGDLPMKYPVQWVRGGVDIPGANSVGYTIQAADVGRTDIVCRVTATNAQGSTPVLSTPASVLPTNLVSKSDALGSWTLNATTQSPNVTLDPVNNTMTADRIVEQASTNIHSVASANISFVSGTTYTFSVYGKYETAQFVQLLFGSTAFGSTAYANFDLQNGTVQTVGAGVTARAVPAGNGWYRLIITAPATATAAAAVGIYGCTAGNSARAQSYLGAVANTRLLTDIQVETGVNANAYVPTL